MQNTFASLRAAWLTAQRAGLRRVLRRLERAARLQVLDPTLGAYLYRSQSFDAEQTLESQQYELLKHLARLRLSSPVARKWNWQDETLTLLNQEPFSLKLPVNWRSALVDDPLWAFRLHSWEWAWPTLGDKSCRDKVFTLWQDWVNQVPIGRGPAWQPYPTSRRLTVWSAAWHLFNGESALAAAIAQHAAYLADHLERDLDNNHLIANAKALAWVGLLFPDVPQAQKWCETGLNLLWSALDAQVQDDGGHVENASSYHLAVWLDGLETAMLCKASGQPVPARVWDVLEKMGHYALALRRPDGRLPLLNDSIQDEPLPVETIFDLAAEAFDQSAFAWASEDTKASDPTLGSQAFEDSGYAVLRSGVGSHDTYVIFDAGNLGPHHCPGHGHADALSIEMWSGGEPLIVDPGVYHYAKGRWRDYFRGAAAHSTATVDGLDQSSFTGPFRVGRMAHGRFISIDVESETPTVIGEHDGYTRLRDPVIHRRRLCLHDPKHLEIVDTFSGSVQHRVDIRFHLSPCETKVLDQQRVEATYPGGVRLLITVENPEVTVNVEKGWASRTWYRKETCPVLKFSFEDRLPKKVTTHLRRLSK